MSQETWEVVVFVLRILLGCGVFFVGYVFGRLDGKWRERNATLHILNILKMPVTPIGRLYVLRAKAAIYDMLRKAWKME